MYHIFFIHSFVDGHLGSFPVLATVNSAAVNTGVHIPFLITAFPGYMPRNEIAGTYGVLPMFSAKSFVVPGLMFRSFIHFELFLCMVLDNVPNSFFYM